MARQPTSLRPTAMRSQLGRVRGLGSAGSGVEIWWAERVTSIALVPLSIWFIVAVIAHLGADRAAIARWIGQPVNTVLLLALVIATFRHMALGLQAVIEDYVHGELARMVSLLVMRGAAWVLGLASVVAVVKLAF